METLNETKAKEIATTHDGKIIGFAHIAALQMAQWKDEQEIEFLQSLMFHSAAFHIFDKINERIKLLKGE